MKRGLGYPRRSIRVKLFASYVLITLPLLALALYFAREWSQQQQALLTIDARQGAMNTALRLGSFFDRTGVTLSAISRNPSIQSGTPEQAAAILDPLLPIVPRLSNLRLVSLDGEVLVMVPNDGSSDVWVGDRDYFRAVVGGMPFSVSGGLLLRDAESDRSSGFVVAVPIKDEQGRLVRVLAASVHARELQEDLLPSLNAAGASILVIDQYDRIVLHSQESLLGRQVNLGTAQSMSQDSGEPSAIPITDPLSGRTSPARLWPVAGDSGWSVIAIEPIGHLQADDTRRTVWVTLLALMALALAAAFAVLLGGRMSDRVTRLSKAAALLADGNLGAQVPITGLDETTTLSKMFNTMSARLAEMVQQLDETRRSLQRSHAEVGQALTAGFEAEQTLALILRVVMSRLNVPAALVGRLDEERRTLRWVAVTGPFKRPLMDVTVPVDDVISLASRAVMEQTIVQGHDPSVSLTIDGPDGLGPSGVPSGLAAPLRLGGHVKGVIEILDYAGRSFGGEEIADLLSFAESASLALDKAVFFARTERQKAFVQSVLDSLPIAVGVVQASTYVHELVNPMYCSMIGAEGDRSEQQTSLDLDSSSVASALRGSVQAVLETGSVQRLEHLTSAGGQCGRASHWDITCSPLPNAVGRSDWVLITGVDTTEHVSARGEIESLARIAEHRAHELETVISSMSDGVLVVDRNGNLIMDNDAARRIIGTVDLFRRAEDAHRHGRPCYPSGQSIPMEQLPQLRAARGEHFSQSEMVIHEQDGTEKLLSISGAPLLDQDGQPRGGVCVFHDVTEQRRRAARQRLLAEVSQLFNSSMDLAEVLCLVVNKTANALDAWCTIHLLDESGQFLSLRAIHHPDPELTRRAERMLGERPLRLDELQLGRVLLADGPVLMEKFEPDDLRQIARSVRGLARTKEEVATSFLAVPLQAHGRVLGAMSVTCTGSRRRLTREDLALAVDLAERAALALDNARLYQQTEGERLRLRSIVDSLPEGIIVAEGDEGDVTTANCVAEAMWGRPIPPGTKLADLAEALIVSKPGGEGATSPMALLDTIATGQTVLSYESTIQRPDGSTLEVLASSAPCWYGSGRGTGMVAVFQDISRIKEIERLKDEFLSITSHELRTPLTSLKGFAQILLRRAQRASDRQQDVNELEIINRQINRMVALVGDLLDVSRIEAGQVVLSRQRLDLVSLTRQVVKQAQKTVKHRRFKVEAVESSVEGWWDERRLEQVLANLLDNAVKYGQDGPIEIAVRRWDDEAVVSVRDQGAGLSRDSQAHLFQRFYRGGNISTRSIGGLGLGLYISDQLVRCHGGRMWVDSEEGQGSTFWFALPILDGDDRSTGGEDGQYA
ncbi:MAG: PAS domain S-box protein [Chloroflexota bacterium]|nr:MAG: PAS domain S-box protein [Chloroflexota bacterium]